MLSLCFLSYLGFYETTFGVQASARTLKSLKKGLSDSPCLAGKWEIVWGPAMYRLPLTVFDENLMFVARSTTDTSEYAIVIRGTNPVSITNWLLQDFDVMQQTPWPYSHHTGALRPKLSKGTARGLQALQSMKPRRGIPGAGQTLYQFLAAEIANSPRSKMSITVTGHSLGGALSPTLALWLADTQRTSDDPKSPPWDPKLQASLSVCSFAGPSPGNADFASYYDQTLGTTTRRIWNSHDVVPHGWTEDALGKLPQLYGPNVMPDMLMDLVLWSTRIISRNGNYRHVRAESVAMDGGKVVPLFKDYVAQMLYQHTAAYPALLALDHEIDSTIHFRFDDVLHHAIGNVLATSRTSRTNGAAQPSGEYVGEHAARAVHELGGRRRSPAHKVASVAKALHRLYRVPGTVAMALLPQRTALHHLLGRADFFHAHRSHHTSH